MEVGDEVGEGAPGRRRYWTISLWCNRPFSAQSAVDCLNEKSIGQNANSARTALNRAYWPA